MNDRRVRELERAWKESGARQDLVAWIQGRIRAGELKASKAPCPNCQCPIGLRDLERQVRDARTRALVEIAYEALSTPHDPAALRAIFHGVGYTTLPRATGSSVQSLEGDATQPSCRAPTGPRSRRRVMTTREIGLRHRKHSGGQRHAWAYG